MDDIPVFVWQEYVEGQWDICFMMMIISFPVYASKIIETDCYFGAFSISDRKMIK